MKKLNITEKKGGTAITVHVLPQSSKTEIAGILDDGTLKIKLIASPVDDKANKDLIKLLAKFFGISKSHVEIIAGGNSENKLIALIGITPEKVNQLVRDFLSVK